MTKEIRTINGKNYIYYANKFGYYIRSTEGSYAILEGCQRNPRTNKFTTAELFTIIETNEKTGYGEIVANVFSALDENNIPVELDGMLELIYEYENGDEF